MSEVVIVASGSGNLRSVQNAITAVGGSPTLSSDPNVVRNAERLIVPGQGRFGDCLAKLRSQDLHTAIGEFIQSGRPFFGICLGLQILFESSEEDPDAVGLGILPGHVQRFNPEDSTNKVPHMGWNEVERKGQDDPMLKGIVDSVYFYFVHSFYAPLSPDFTVLECTYEIPFSAAVRKENIFAAQFHPEKSSHLGLQLLKNFLETK